MFAIIPDIHADYARLSRTLEGLGFQGPSAAWKSHWYQPDGIKAVFLGDFIDGGRDNARVIQAVRGMVEAGEAFAIMGNHELNALLFHTPGHDGKSWLRPRTEKNVEQHRSFLDEFGCNDDTDFSMPRDGNLKEALDWFLSLPLALDFGAFRVVHAQWEPGSVSLVQERLGTRRTPTLLHGDLPEIATCSSAFGDAVDRMLKGAEVLLPDGVSFVDRGKNQRYEMRVRWWASGEPTYRNLALSVPDPSVLPNDLVREVSDLERYPVDGPPVFVGHYKMHGEPQIDEGSAAACLDFPQKACAYLWKEGDSRLMVNRLLAFP